MMIYVSLLPNQFSKTPGYHICKIPSHTINPSRLFVREVKPFPSSTSYSRRNCWRMLHELLANIRRSVGEKGSQTHWANRRMLNSVKLVEIKLIIGANTDISPSVLRLVTVSGLGEYYIWCG